MSYGLQATYSHEAQATMIPTSHNRELDVRQVRHPGTRSTLPPVPPRDQIEHVPPPPAQEGHANAFRCPSRRHRVFPPSFTKEVISWISVAVSFAG